MQFVSLKIVGDFKQIQALFRTDEGSNHRRVFIPGTDVSAEASEIQEAASAWTDEDRAAYQSAMEAV